VQIPSQLQDAIENEVSKYGLSKLTKAATELSEKYRRTQQPTGRFITAEINRLAYLAVRMPATFAAAHSVMSEIRRLMPEIELKSLLDLGAGPGTAAWAAVEVFDELQEITLVEQDADLIRLGQLFARESKHTALSSAHWQLLNLKTANSFPISDLVVYSYSLGEVETSAAIEIVESAWHAARHATAIIEPGTTRGFELIRVLRNRLIENGGYIVAPCPHQRDCPMTPQDWCHFAQRFERTSLHRRIKKGSLGHEDEKFSYLVAAKLPCHPIQARIIRRPLKHSGYAQIQLCTKDQLENIIVTRSNKELWRRVKKVVWGDEWE
jgi:ribosomal protein RSM22 (predicted rRNA methylase)